MQSRMPNAAMIPRRTMQRGRKDGAHDTHQDR